MENLTDFLEAELARRSWRPADLARAAGVPDATISHILNGSRRAGPDVCNALARALDKPPERIFRLAGLLPPVPPAVEEEQEAVRILRGLSPDLREAAMRMLRGLRPGVSPAPSPGLAHGEGVAASHSTEASPTRPPGRVKPDPHLAVLEQLWDKTPDWKKKDIAAQIRASVDEYQREQEEQVAGQAGDEGREAN